MAENPVNPDANEIGQTYADEPVTLGRAGGEKKRLNAAVVACLVALALIVLAAVVSLL
ncbi:MAG: hypothetical protein JWM62_3147 [Frankiales bacterium]|jgi:hypothetical protein|nr:hypothetical protein [Frankiales bacterium]